jgi:osmotically-inducible protein OsmY
MNTDPNGRAPRIIGACLIAASGAACQPSQRTPPLLDTTLTSTERPKGASTPGPKLADREIVAAIRRELARDPGVAPSDVELEVTDGIVELTGTVDNVLAKERATRRTELVKGVRAVSNRIVVRAPPIDDAVLARDVKDALQFDAATHAYEIDVAAKSGVVTLKGTAQSHGERLLSGRVAMGVRGVAEVKNAIDVDRRIKRADSAIASDVESRLRWDALVDHALVRVAVKDAKVSLTGVVGSAAEKQRAYWDAWLQGVSDVDVSGLEVKGWARNLDLRRDKYVVRSDAEVMGAIKAVTGDDPRVRGAAVDVSVAGGVATLKGTVASLKAKKAAEQLAENTVGVLGVDNQLEIRTTTALTDSELQRRVHAALSLDPDTVADPIAAKAEAGTIVLSGPVSSYFQKAEAESVASDVLGVRTVDNRIEVKKPAPAFTYDPYLYPFYPYVKTRNWRSAKNDRADVQITRDIEAQLFWSPFVSSDQVHVLVENGKATLTGEVGSTRERSVATQDAYAGGATLVDNQLRVR